VIGTSVVTAAIAAANGIGLGRYPSSEAWCSLTMIGCRPRAWRYAACSIERR
jgi:hypothetical protein